MQFVVLIGASGSGKTAIAHGIDRRHSDQIDVFSFDTIGVPSEEQMIIECGSAEGWQRTKTMEWMAKLAPISRSGHRVLFEGQTRLSFLAEGAQEAGGIAYVPILVDCDDDTRSMRLRDGRQQPKLATREMMNWARYLRREAKRCGCEILDTSELTIEQCVGYVMDRLIQT